MSRWAPIPTAIGSSLPMADLSPSAKCVWFALRIAHALHGHGGVVPVTVASTRSLPLVVPALVAGLDVAADLADLARAGLTRPHDGGLALTDWDVEAEQAPCSSCRRRNPDPRHHRCPACRARDTDPTRRAGRKRGADVAQTDRANSNGPVGQEPQGFAGNGDEVAQTIHRHGADLPRPRPDPTRPDIPDQTESPDTRAGALEAPASPAGEPIRPQNAPAARQQQSPAAGDVRAIAGTWAVEMAERGIEKMRPAIHAADVGRLLDSLPGGVPPSRVHDRDAFAVARREGWVRIIAWCPSPERLARWCVVAVRRYRATNVAGYLRRAAERGDPGTMLARSGQGEGVLPRAVEGALQGERADDVAKLIAGATTVVAETDPAERARLRAELARCLHAGRRDGARRVLLRLMGSDRSDIALARATDGVCPIDEARRLIA